MKQILQNLTALCISGSEKGADFIRSLFDGQAETEAVCVGSAAAASAMLRTKKFDLCLINAPLPDGDAAQLATEITAAHNTAVLLFVKAEDYDRTVEETASYGVFTVAKPGSAKFFQQALQLVCTVKRREKAEDAKLLQMQAKLDEIKIVNRAKLVLIQYLKMDEAKAHRYIEKQAMDRRITRREVAEIIISTYEY